MLPPLIVLALSLPRVDFRDPQEAPRAADARADALFAWEGEPHAPIRVVYEGTTALEAHLEKPHDVLLFGTRITIVADGDRARLDWETWRPGREKDVDLDTTWVDGARVWNRPHAASPGTEVRGKAALLLRARVEAFLPWRMLATIRSAPEHVSDRSSDGWTFTEPGSLGARRFTRGGSPARLERVTRAFAHPRLGDVQDEIVYASWSKQGDVTLPDALSLQELDGPDVLKASPVRIEVRSTQATVGADVVRELSRPESTSSGESEPSAESASRAQASDASALRIEVEELEPGVVVFTAPDLDGRTVVVEFADHLVAIDAPLSSALGERILRSVHERFPAKAVRYVLFGHYHPHYTGGLRAFLADGATVVAPNGCAQFAAEIAKRPFTIEPDAWARKGGEPKIETFALTRTFEDASRRLDVHDIGASSHHTAEYLVFHLPASRLLLQDDIGWFTGPDGQLRFSARSRGLRDAIVERKLDVAKLWQSWPVRNARASITYEELEKGLASAR